MSKEKFEKIIKREIDEYLNLSVMGMPCKVPYIFGSSWLEFWRTGGKGSINDIRVESEKLFKLYDLDPSEMTEFERYKFLRSKRVGIDCSGMVYQIFDIASRELLNKPLKELINRKKGIIGEIDKKLLGFKRERRVASRHLTSDLNSVSITNLLDLQIGDMIKMSTSDPKIGHVAIIYEVDRTCDKITYAHSSFHTKKVGPHLGIINVLDWNKLLEDQEWEEQSTDNKTDLSIRVKSAEGMGIRRLKIFEGLN